MGRVCRYIRCVACSRSPVVFVDQAAKPIPALHSTGRDSDHVHRLPGPALTETLMFGRARL
jgi:hypothetical protein